MRQYVSEDRDYQESVRAFLEIGNARNELAHGNYAMYPLEKTIEEIYASYKTGLRFVESIGSHLARVSSAVADEA